MKALLILLLASQAFGYTKDSPSSGFKSAATSAFGQPEYKDESIDLGTSYAEVRLSSAQVKTLFTTPVLAVTSPGSGKALFPIAAYATLDFNSTAWVANSNNHLDVEFGGSGSGTVAVSIDEDLMEASSDKGWFAYGSTNQAAQQNTALYLHTSGANPTIGDSPITVRIYYKVVPYLLSTGN